MLPRTKGCGACIAAQLCSGSKEENRRASLLALLAHCVGSALPRSDTEPSGKRENVVVDLINPKIASLGP
ncbi:hypothetical protein Mapa_013359 [Marchantia paleacea]|nr:hypothetical protein Mapa_013359 [Marchantia paleacea]